MKTKLFSLLVVAALGSVQAQGPSLSIMAPSTVGGGWDVLACALADTLKSTGR